MTKLWFRTRDFGWGWTPISWEGWAVVVATILLAFLGAAVLIYALKSGANGKIALPLFFMWIGLVIAGTMAIGYAKGEPPEWRWGSKD